MKKILFVCHGNICRSPMAEFILKNLLKTKGLEKEYSVESAAVSNEECGNPIYPPAKHCLTEHGIEFDPKKTARTITPKDYDLFDLIIYMDKNNLQWMRSIFGEDREGKIHSMMSYAGEYRDVADPWYTRNFERTYQDILEGCVGFIKSEGRE